jgi:hypothetical protein
MPIDVLSMSIGVVFVVDSIVVDVFDRVSVSLTIDFEILDNKHQQKANYQNRNKFITIYNQNYNYFQSLKMNNMKRTKKLDLKQSRSQKNKPDSHSLRVNLSLHSCNDNTKKQYNTKIFKNIVVKSKYGIDSHRHCRCCCFYCFLKNQHNYNSVLSSVGALSGAAAVSSLFSPIL